MADDTVVVVFFFLPERTREIWALTLVPFASCVTGRCDETHRGKKRWGAAAAAGGWCSDHVHNVVHYMAVAHTEINEDEIE